VGILRDAWLTRARAYYQSLRDCGTGHQAALRQLGNRLVGILHGCLKTRTAYNEATAWPISSPALDFQNMQPIVSAVL
jgi:hypothetical protein